MSHQQAVATTKSSEMEPLQVEYKEVSLSNTATSAADDYDDRDAPDGIFRDTNDVPRVAWAAWLFRNNNAWVYDYLFPPHVPPECQLLRTENLAIPSCYLLVGLLQGLSSVAVNVLPLDLGASEAQQTTLSSIRSLPASFKLLFGFISDTVPIAGYRRKPYMFGGWLLASMSMFALYWGSNLAIPARNTGCFGEGEEEDENRVVPDDAPSIPFLSICLLLFGTGFWVADVMGDSIVAEKAKLELPEHRGSLQSTCYACRFFGLMVAAPISTALYSGLGPAFVIGLLAVLPLSILPVVYLLREYMAERPPTVREQCQEIWSTVCSRAVWQPMGFVYLYNIMQVGNGAWREYLVTVHHFTSCQLNMLLIVSYVLLYLGVLAYKRYFITWSWRHVYIYTTLLNGLFSLLQVLLIYGITFGLSPFLFTLGDDAFAEFISGIQFLPNTIMMVHLCPSGSEGASYAMFTTVNNSALTMSSMLSTQLLKIWDVTRTAFENGSFTGMINLTYLTTFSQTAAVLAVGLLPHYKEDLMALGTSSPKSMVGGSICLLVTFATILYSLYVGVSNIVAPASG